MAAQWVSTDSSGMPRRVKEEGLTGVRFHRVSPDGEQGFPGTMDVNVTYWLTDNNTVRVEYEATTDKPTVVNLSNHTYFNLKGNEGGYVMDHLLQVEADTCIQNNAQFCPDILRHVDGSPFDFREPHRVDYRIDMPDEHLRIMRGMSACWAVRNWDGTLRKAADLYDRKSGRGMQTWTTRAKHCSHSPEGVSTVHIKGNTGRSRSSVVCSWRPSTFPTARISHVFRARSSDRARNIVPLRNSVFT